MDIDITSVAKIIAPALPFLFGLAEKGEDNTSETLAERIWEKLFPKLKEKPAALEAASDVAKSPEDEDAHAFLRVQLKKILSDPQNTDLANEITQILQEESAPKPVFQMNFNDTITRIAGIEFRNNKIDNLDSILDDE